MPKFLLPGRHGPHRAAGMLPFNVLDTLNHRHLLRGIAIALYRALLKQISAVALQQNERHAFQNVVRNQFNTNRLLTSDRLLQRAFTAGYRVRNHILIRKSLC